jgi:hypothetical protein
LKMDGPNHWRLVRNLASEIAPSILVSFQPYR